MIFKHILWLVLIIAAVALVFIGLKALISPAPKLQKFSETDIIELTPEKAKQVIAELNPENDYPLPQQKAGNRIYFQKWDTKEGGEHGKNVNKNGVTYISWFGYQDMASGKVYRFNFIPPLIDADYKIEPGIKFIVSGDGQKFAWAYRIYFPDKDVRYFADATVGAADLEKKVIYPLRKYPKPIWIYDWTDKEHIRISYSYAEPPYYALNIVSGQLEPTNELK